MTLIIFRDFPFQARQINGDSGWLKGETLNVGEILLRYGQDIIGCLIFSAREGKV